MSPSPEAGSLRECGGEARVTPRWGVEEEGRRGGKVGSDRRELGTQPPPQPLAGSSREEGASAWKRDPTMPKVFLVKRKSPGVTVRSWDELPDEKRADTYIPGERRAGAGPGHGALRVGEGVDEFSVLVGRGWTPPPHLPLSIGGRWGLPGGGKRGVRLGSLGRPALPSP